MSDTHPAPDRGPSEPCPKCMNTLQNANPSGSPHLRRCATCKTIWQPSPTPPAAPVPGAEPIPGPTAEQLAEWKRIVEAADPSPLQLIHEEQATGHGITLHFATLILGVRTFARDADTKRNRADFARAAAGYNALPALLAHAADLAARLADSREEAADFQREETRLRQEIRDLAARIAAVKGDLKLADAERSSAFDAAMILLKALGWESGGLAEAAREMVAARDAAVYDASTLTEELGLVTAERDAAVADAGRLRELLERLHNWSHCIRSPDPYEELEPLLAEVSAALLAGAGDVPSSTPLPPTGGEEGTG